MSMYRNIIPFRPAALPAVGFRVDMHDFADSWHVLLFQNRVVASQRGFTVKREADEYARALADDHRCAVIHHNHDGLIARLQSQEGQFNG